MDPVPSSFTIASSPSLRRRNQWDGQRREWLYHPICDAFSNLEKDVRSFKSILSSPLKQTTADDLTVLQRNTTQHGAAMLSLWTSKGRKPRQSVISSDGPLGTWCDPAPVLSNYFGWKKMPTVTYSLVRDVISPFVARRYIGRLHMNSTPDPSAMAAPRKFLWVPARVKTACILVGSSSWEEFWPELEQALGTRPFVARLRAASESLTMVMAILYGLENLNDDDAWTLKDTLTIHSRFSARLTKQENIYLLDRSSPPLHCAYHSSRFFGLFFLGPVNNHWGLGSHEMQKAAVST
ncbi:hypothetical protein B0H13DRAFT_1924166 [Mycena leptocephala]|nr:hypothetical protein B0H13DRAFT_1924166 [Mycena leptocephala]